MLAIVFRADASLHLGSGHIMRCLTLATALKPFAICHFICRAENGHLAALIQQQGFTVSLLSAANPIQPSTDASQSLAQLSTLCDILIVDHYQLGAEYCQIMRQQCHRIMVIDDLANRQHDCDLLLDQNLLPDSALRYTRLVPTHCEMLIGPTYGLLREEFSTTYNEKREPNRLLVFFGGGDTDHLTIKTLNALTQLKFQQIKADIVISAVHPARTEISQRCQQLPGVELHVQCHYMAKLMHRAGLMIGAGGSTHWERCKCALPGLIVTIAENQLATTAYLDKLGACIWLGNAADISEALLTEKIDYYLGKPKLLQAVATTANSLIPANSGAQAIVKALLALQ